MREANCTYKDERYSVRDNGEVWRHPRDGKRPRPTDNQWTYGKPNDKTGYMEIGTARVHRIVATAFIEVAPTKEHVVDHIDTNKRNNRPENLRWVTRLENILLNPITIKRIELACGCKVEEFLADPSKFRDRFPEPNYSWMCTVSKEEAQSSLDRMLSWAKTDKRPSRGSLGEWIFNRVTSMPDVPKITISKTLNAVQLNWEVPSEFPCCPQEVVDPISDYAEKLRPGLVFCQNDVYSSLVSEIVLSEDRKSIYIITESSQGEKAIKPWALAKIIYENDLFVHISLGNFFTHLGAEKECCLDQGFEWSGGESIDDYC